MLYKSCSRVFPCVSANGGKHVQTFLIKENQCLICMGLSYLEPWLESPDSLWQFCPARQHRRVSGLLWVTALESSSLCSRSAL